MDKLQWFKFTPSDWMMGKIQRCPEVTQARFMRLCCLYWNKECNLSIEDAEIEIDKEHFDILIAKKIISKNETYFNISFLDEQFLEIQESSNDKSKSGIIGNLKRWHLAIYNDYEAKKISLEKAIELSKVIADQSHPDSTPIADQSQPNRETSQRREEKTIQDNTRQDNTRQDNTIQEVLLEKDVPPFDEFLEYAIEKKPKVCPIELKLKYEAWKENGWKDGHDKTINKWRSKLLQTLPYIKDKSFSSPNGPSIPSYRF